jgi:hypothetical protein
MVLIVELTEKFGPALDVPGIGKCLAVPGSEFDPDWEAELDDQGFTVLFETWDNHPMTVVPLKILGDKEVQKMENKVEMEEKARVYWSPEEDAFLVELWKSDLTIDQISLSVAEKFPIRVGKAVKSRLDRLKTAGKIQCRKHSGNEVKKMEKKNQVAGRGSGCRQGPDWTQAQTDLLTASWEQLKALPKEKRAQLLAKMPEFAGRSANSILQKAYKLQTSKEAERSPKVPKVDVCSENAPGTLDKRSAVEVEPEPKWNGEFGEKCNLEHDCIVCDITECPGRKSERLPKVDEADAIVALVAKTQVLSEVYESHSKAYVELRAVFETYSKRQTEILEGYSQVVTDLAVKCAKLQKQLVEHEHVESGKAMFTLEAS